jgi:hypothetical protein
LHVLIKIGLKISKRQQQNLGQADSNDAHKNKPIYIIKIDIGKCHIRNTKEIPNYTKEIG